MARVRERARSGANVWHACAPLPPRTKTHKHNKHDNETRFQSLYRRGAVAKERQPLVNADVDERVAVVADVWVVAATRLGRVAAAGPPPFRKRDFLFCCVCVCVCVCVQVVGRGGVERC